MSGWDQTYRAVAEEFGWVALDQVDTLGYPAAARDLLGATVPVVLGSTGDEEVPVFAVPRSEMRSVTQAAHWRLKWSMSDQEIVEWLMSPVAEVAEALGARPIDMSTRGAITAAARRAEVSRQQTRERFQSRGEWG